MLSACSHKQRRHDKHPMVHCTFLRWRTSDSNDLTSPLIMHVDRALSIHFNCSNNTNTAFQHSSHLINVAN